MLFCGATPTPVFVIDAPPPVAIPVVVKGFPESLDVNKILSLAVRDAVTDELASLLIALAIV